MAIFSLTRPQIRRLLIPSVLDQDDYLLAETPESATSTSFALSQYANIWDDAHWAGGECIATVSGSTVTRRITDYDSATGTFTVVSLGGTPSAVDLLRANTRVRQLDTAIERAVTAVAKDMLIDRTDTSLMTDGGSDYPLPSWVYLNGVSIDWQGRHVNGLSYLGTPGHTTMTEYGIKTASSSQKRGQVFQLSREVELKTVWLKLRNIGSATGTLTLTIETVASSLPAGTTMTNATATYDVASISGAYVWVPFTFTNPVVLAADTEYAITVSPDYSASTSVYIAWKADTNANYQYGSACVYDGSSWSAVSADHLFVLQGNRPEWRDLRDEEFSLLHTSTRQVRIVPRTGLPEGLPLLLKGQGPGTALNGDDDTCDIDPEYVTAQAAATFLMSHGATDEGKLRQALTFQQLADQLKKRLVTTGQGLKIQSQ